MRGHAGPRGGKREHQEMKKYSVPASLDTEIADLPATGKPGNSTDRCASPAASPRTPDKEGIDAFQETRLVKRKTGTAALVVSEEGWVSLGILERAHPCPVLNSSTASLGERLAACASEHVVWMAS